ncbi:hypothetical protein GW17_00019660 [Ensete ventricosum]|nr:hypothetical protein GW17_00019660 [Ensete ventricosum]
MRENESLKAELPGRSIANYKQSVGFWWGLRRMGQVSYEYRYRIALARFRARYPDLEVDSDSFTEQLEDSSVHDDASTLSNHYDDSVRTLPSGCQFTLSSSWITYLGFAQDEVARGTCQGIGLACRGAVSTRSGSADYDVDPSFDWVNRACLSISLRSPVWVVPSPLDIMTEVSLADQVLDLILQVPTFFGVVAVFMVETIIYALVPFLGLGLDVVWWCQEPLPLIWRKILVRVEFRGIIGGRERLKSGPSILLLDDPEVDPWGCSVRGRFCSSRFSTIRVSTAMKWFALYIFSGTVVGGFSTKDQNSLDGRIPIKKAWITKEGYASGIARVSVANLLTN